MEDITGEVLENIKEESTSSDDKDVVNWQMTPNVSEIIQIKKECESSDEEEKSKNIAGNTSDKKETSYEPEQVFLKTEIKEECGLEEEHSENNQSTVMNDEEKPETFRFEKEECELYPNDDENVDDTDEINSVDMDSVDESQEMWPPSYTFEHDGKVKCAHCDIYFDNLNALQIHCYSDHIEKCKKKAILFQCKTCPYKTKRKGDFNKHRITHRDVDHMTKIKCPLCEYYTYRKGDLRLHSKVHNREALKFSCDQCSYTTIYKSSMNKHARVHACKIVHECPYCDISFSTKSSLKVHILKDHHYGRGKVYQCATCSYSTVKRGDYDKHLSRLPSHNT